MPVLPPLGLLLGAEHGERLGRFPAFPAAMAPVAAALEHPDQPPSAEALALLLPCAEALLAVVTANPEADRAWARRVQAANPIPAARTAARTTEDVDNARAHAMEAQAGLLCYRLLYATNGDIPMTQTALNDELKRVFGMRLALEPADVKPLVTQFQNFKDESREPHIVEMPRQFQEASLKIFVYECILLSYLKAWRRLMPQAQQLPLRYPQQPALEDDPEEEPEAPAGDPAGGVMQVDPPAEGLRRLPDTPVAARRPLPQTPGSAAAFAQAISAPRSSMSIGSGSSDRRVSFTRDTAGGRSMEAELAGLQAFVAEATRAGASGSSSGKQRARSPALSEPEVMIVERRPEGSRERAGKAPPEPEVIPVSKQAAWLRELMERFPIEEVERTAPGTSLQEPPARAARGGGRGGVQQPDAVFPAGAGRLGMGAGCLNPTMVILGGPGSSNPTAPYYEDKLTALIRPMVMAFSFDAAIPELRICFAEAFPNGASKEARAAWRFFPRELSSFSHFTSFAVTVAARLMDQADPVIGDEEHITLLHAWLGLCQLVARSHIAAVETSPPHAKAMGIWGPIAAELAISLHLYVATGDYSTLLTLFGSNVHVSREARRLFVEMPQRCYYCDGVGHRTDNCVLARAHNAQKQALEKAGLPGPLGGAAAGRSDGGAGNGQRRAPAQPANWGQYRAPGPAPAPAPAPGPAPERSRESHRRHREHDERETPSRHGKRRASPKRR